MKNIWRGIKQISIKSRDGGGIPSQIMEERSVLSDSTSIAQAFNNFFANVSNVGNILAVSVPCEGVSPLSWFGETPMLHLSILCLFCRKK
jgi:hypothetical protein